MTPIRIAKDRVKNRAERLSPIWWQGKQWAVTERGIECRDGSYFIAADRLTETHDKKLSWPVHMAGKNWVDIDDFCTAFMVALLLHGHGGDPLLMHEDGEPCPFGHPLRTACSAAIERRKEGKAWSKRFEAHMIATGKWKKGDEFAASPPPISSGSTEPYGAYVRWGR